MADRKLCLYCCKGTGPHEPVSPKDLPARPEAKATPKGAPEKRPT